jgi:hypothetical protein
MATERAFRVIVFQHGQQWVAQVLERDIAVQAANLRDLPAKLRRALDAEVTLSNEQGVEPFSTLRPAPARYVAMWNGAGRIPEEETWRDVHPLVAVSATRAAIRERT